MAGKKILVIDDEPDLVKALEVRLKSEGYDVITAFDGLSGLNLAREQQPDIILLDIMLPKLDGYKVSRFLKFDEQYKKIPIIMVTAKAEEHDKELGTETGADLYITKPFDEDELLSSIRRLT